MISNTAQTNTFTTGLDLDTDLAYIQNSSYRDAHNIRVITNDGGTTATIQSLEKSKKYNLSQAITGTIVASLAIKDIGVVISYFYKTTPGDAYYNIYRLEHFYGDTLTVTKVLSGVIGLSPTSPISIVGNVESDDIYKIYFTDGNSPLCVLNMFDTRFLPGTENVDDEGYIKDKDLISITPSSLLSRPEYVGIVSGNLKPGKVSYCYQLFNENGTQTQVSPMSRMIHLAASDTEDADYYKGNMPDDTINRGVVIKIDDIPEGFTRVRIIRLSFTQNNSVPKIEIATEQIIGNASTFGYTDTGNTISEYTIDEFNSLRTYSFTAKALAKKDNRLFAANITENSWNPVDENGNHYDARAYRCNADGATVLESLIVENNIEITDIDSYDLSSIPEDHDCINPFNAKGYDALVKDEDETEMYMYGRTEGSSRVLGGYGTNIDYSFITTRVELSVMADETHSEDTFKYGIESSEYATKNGDVTTYQTIDIYEVGTSNFWTIDNRGDNNIVLNTYASPFFANHFTGYRRDELYRFGIVFYNEVGMNTPVYWIGDIRMPSVQQVPIILNTNGRSYGQALGIRFNVKNMPEGAISYEIVRCEKTENDRSIIGQVLVDGIYNYRINDHEVVGNGDVLEESTEYRPLPFFHAENTWKLKIVADPDLPLVAFNTEDIDIPNIQSSSVYRITSPEICLQGESLESMFKGARLSYLGHYYSLIEPDTEDRSKNFATESNEPGVDKTKTYTRDDSSEETGIMTALFTLDNTNGEFIQCSYVSKYFYYSPNHIESSQTIEDAVYPPCIEYNVMNIGGTYQILSPYTVSVGDIQYTNYSMSCFDYVNNANYELMSQPIFGPAGPCIVVSVDDYDQGGLFLSGAPYNDDNLTMLDAINCVALGNVVKDNYTAAYGGNSYAARTNSTYISTGNYQIDGTDMVYGGDTYVGIFDYLNTSTYQPNDNSQYYYSRHSVCSYVPMESDINLNLMSGTMMHNSRDIPFNIQLQPVQMGNYYVQTKPYYEYNDAYSAQNNSKLFVTTGMYDVDNKHYSNRIMVSEAKVNGEVIDSWSSFKIANYLDVDNQYGDITNLYVFKNNLFFWQDSSVGIASVNERSLITDGNNNQVVLGTGGVLSRYDYITNNNGSSMISNNTIVNSDNTLYWYDDNKNEICCYNGAVTSLSKEKRVQSYLNENKLQPVSYTNSNALFDKKYNEIWFKIFDDNLIFNEQTGSFTSKYNHLKNTKSLTLFDKCVVIDNNEFYEINRDDTSKQDDTNRDADITFVVNKDYQYTKVFDNIRFYSEPDTNAISSIEFKTQGDKQSATINTPSFDYREDTYRMAVPRQDNFDEEDNMSYPARLRSKCMIEKFNFTVDKDNSFKIPYITTTYRYSLI